MITRKAEGYHCGPLEVLVTSHSEALRRKVADTLELYNVPWADRRSRLHLDIEAADEPSPLGPGAYLTCARMNVDRASGIADGSLIATCRSGMRASGDAHSGRWIIGVPDADHSWILTDMENVLSLVLTEGWRAAGWVPVHAATAIRHGICAMICAESGGGKTTLTAALVRRGWQTLGDDKLLLRVTDDGSPELRALVHTFNLHPRTRSWFTEVGDLERLPVYSEWTEKRKVHPESIWAGATATRATPTHLVLLRRVECGNPISVTPMKTGDVLSALLHQTVVPSDSRIARHVLSTVVAAASRLDGFSVEVCEDAYNNPDCLAPLEHALS